ncbi:predicted protein [Plenodomus lingam JN3]|uniref:Predicted protein n=1 Tax=Leptosphaeria maculans (strain JN3 / isolate v23.1.3 / race Av1-4-5-6-7-8) TaxID=985895 RepID=E5A5B9_LEPMJ|nr:predicted protein [Plenodomus lingam JN3]CBX98817.1 predicted protein [Plenodomus lingam JN3]
MLEIVFLQRPVLSAADTHCSYSIVRVSLVPRAALRRGMMGVWVRGGDVCG